MLKNRIIGGLLIVILLMAAWIVGLQREIDTPKVDHLYIFRIVNLEGGDIKDFHIAFVTNDDRVTQVCGKKIVDNNFSGITTQICGVTK